LTRGDASSLAKAVSQSFFHQGNVSDVTLYPDGKVESQDGNVAILFSSRQCFRRGYLYSAKEEKRFFLILSQSFFHQGNVSDTAEILCSLVGVDVPLSRNPFFIKAMFQTIGVFLLHKGSRKGIVAILFSSRQCFRRILIIKFSYFMGKSLRVAILFSSRQCFRQSLPDPMHYVYRNATFWSQSFFHQGNVSDVDKFYDLFNSLVMKIEKSQSFFHQGNVSDGSSILGEMGRLLSFFGRNPFFIKAMFQTKTSEIL